MTIDIDAIEAKAKHQLQGPCTGMAHEVLELIAELRVKNNLDEVNEWTEELEKNALRNELKRARDERDWLAGVLARTSQEWIMGKIKPFCPSEVCRQITDQKNCVN